MAELIAPRNIPAEEAVIGGILFSFKTALPLVAELLRPEDFYHPVLQAIYEAILDLDSQSKPVDIITVADQMRTLGTLVKLTAYNGEAYLVELASKIATIENVAYHAQLVRDAAILRGLGQVGANLAGGACRPGAAVAAVVEEAERSLFAVALRSTTQRPVPIKQALRESIQALEARYLQKQAITGVPSGFEDFDEKTGGFQKGDLVLVGARPSMGKTSFVMNATLNAAADHGVAVLVFSLEMMRQSLIDRLLCSEARIDSTRFRAGMLETKQWVSIQRAAARLALAPIEIDDASAPTLPEIRAKCRRWRMALPPGQLGMIVIDYLQLIQAASRDGRTQEVSEISRGLKALAKDLAVPVVALSQLSRKCEDRTDKRPMASDLRESGQLEQDADLICFIYRDEVYNKESPDTGTAEIIIGKQRNGATGTVRLAFLGEFTRFENLSRRQGP